MGISERGSRRKGRFGYGRCGYGRGSAPARRAWRWRAAGVLPLLLSLVPGSALTPAASAGVAVTANWPKFHYNDAGSGYNPREHTLSATNVARLTVKWALTTGGATGSAAVVNGVVYVGSGDGDVYAIKAASGTKLWAHHIGGSVAATPAVAGGVVYVGSTSGTMYALSAATGAARWRHALGDAIISSRPWPGGRSMSARRTATSTR